GRSHSPTPRNHVMNRTLALAALLAFGLSLRADDPPTSRVKPPSQANTLTAAEKADGWQLLFDGKTADRWRNYNKETLSDKWQVKDGALVGMRGGDIVTKDEFASYELVLEYRIGKGGNSGIMYHVQEVKGKPPYDSGPEIQIQDNVGGHDPQLSGWLYQMYQ